MSWAERADGLIAAIDAGLATGVDLEGARAALREAGPSFHCGTSWGRKVWSRRCRLYLMSYGSRPRLGPAPLFAPDIVFPFRDAGA